MSDHILIYKKIKYFITFYRIKQLSHGFSKVFRNIIFKIVIKNENTPAL